MNPWVRVLGLFAALAAAALLLQVLPALVVLTLFVGGVVYANHVLTRASKAQGAGAPAQLLGLEAERGGLVLSAYPFALFERGGAPQVTDVVSGRWHGVDLWVFDFSYAPAVRVDGVEGMDVRRAFTCAIVTLELEGPHTVVEPRTFLTADSERPDLPAVEAGPRSLRSSFDIRSEAPGFVEDLLDSEVADWILGQDERWAFEIRGRVLLWYAQRLPMDDRFLLLEAVASFLRQIPALALERHPAGSDVQTPDPPIDLDPDA